MNSLRRKITAKKPSSAVNETTYVDLAPVDDADKDGTYSAALSFAFENPRVKNIALTGPYGSGKTSIIRSFERRNAGKYKFLNISLASFKEEEKADNPDLENRLIEQSILQQMLYGADASRLPYSRFKRISTPRLPLVKSCLVVAWIIAAGLAYLNGVLDLTALPLEYPKSGMEILLILLVSYVIAIPTVLLSDIYKYSFGIPLKKLSLKNAEIETGDISDSSILNRHLDEIIYFFQETDYNIVVIEDLDRFGSPEIFVKLREINKLINDSEKTGGNIKFLYAIKDDMFAHRDRAKFFDFIVPVVPVVNNSNSLEKIRERIKGEIYEKKLDGRFLREVSVHLADLRLIHNIFNEFSIYYFKLRSDTLDATKLLAMMIYKNSYPGDFENLHHGKGILFETCAARQKHIQTRKVRLETLITDLKNQIERSAREELRNLRELIDVYIQNITRHSAQPVIGLVIGGSNVSFSQITGFEQFEPLLADREIRIFTSHPNYANHQMVHSTNKSFTQLEQEINPGETFLDRKRNIEFRSEKQKTEIQQQIKKIEKAIMDLPRQRLDEFLQSGETTETEEKINSLDDDMRLFTYLVKNGYVDDTFYLYTSNFYEGGMTSRDRDFIIAIRSFNVPAPNHPVDTPKEVCQEMREEDFASQYILNVTLIDFLLEENSRNNERLTRAMSFIRDNFDVAQDFLTGYLISGKNIESFVRLLSFEWPRFAVASLDIPNGAEFLSHVLRFVDSDYIARSMNEGSGLTNYISKEGGLLFASHLVSPEDFDVLEKLKVKFINLPLLESNSTLVNFAHERSLYSLTVENVLFVARKFKGDESGDLGDLERCNYTYIQSRGSDCVRDYIERNLSEYIDKIFLVMPDNNFETSETMIRLLNSEVLNQEQKEKVIQKQNYVFTSFDGIPDTLWSFVVDERKMTASWKNLHSYLSSKDAEDAVLTEFLQEESSVIALVNVDPLLSELTDEEGEAVFHFLVSNGDLNEHAYRALLSKLPFKQTDFGDAPAERHFILVEEQKVQLSKESFAATAPNFNLRSLLIERNYESYLAQKDEYPIEDNVRAILLNGNLTIEQKIKICYELGADSADTEKNLPRFVANTLLAGSFVAEEINQELASAAIESASKLDDAIRLLIKFIPIWEEAFVMKTLEKLPDPYREIASYGKRPKLHKGILQTELANVLKSRSLISSVLMDADIIRINTWKSADHAVGEAGE